MVDDVASTTDARAVLRDEIAARALTLSEPSDPANLEDLIRQFVEPVGQEDLEEQGIEHFARVALGHVRLAADRTVGHALVKVHTPTRATDGWDAPHTFIDVVNDDMPFLVDSLTMAVDRHELGVHLVVHPILTVERDGRSVAESWIHIEIDRETDADVVNALQADLERVLRDVRNATSDWDAMIAALIGVINELDATPPPVEPHELSEGKAFLRWLEDQHFTFLGYRAYDLTEGDVLCAVPDSGLGLLRASSGTDKAPEPSASFARLPADVRARARDKTLLLLTKTNARATVHRPTYLDYVGIKRYDAQGNVVGEHRFLGLYTSSAYMASPIDVPVLRRKVGEIVARAGFRPASHSHKDLLAILENYPRDDLFFIEVDDLYDIVLGILHLQERRRVRLFISREPYGRFISCLVYLPRDRYTTPVRERIAQLLMDEFDASSHEWNTYLSASVLARLHFVLRVDPSLSRDVDVPALEARVAQAARAWSDDFRSALIAARGEEHGLDALRAWRTAFPAAYQAEVPASEALTDLNHLEALDDTRLAVRLVAAPDHLDLKLYGMGEAPSLSEVLPRLTNMGVVVDDEHPYTVTPAGRDPRWILHFRMRAPKDTITNASVQRLFEEAFLAVVAGDAEDDGFNRLVLGAGLAWREVALLRAYSRYFRQVGTLYSQAYIEDTLAAQPEIARRLIELFVARLDPWVVANGDADVDGLVDDLEEQIDAVQSLDQDRILRTLLRLVSATLRTNWFQTTERGEFRPAVVLKLDPTNIPDLPLPRPLYEVFVYSPRVEGVHLRSGKVARGGIRWSDRREDFRTEILGLMKAQRVKNAVIVPAGAKGGFVVKQPPSDPLRLRGEVEACYREFIDGLLDITDNFVAGRVVPPPQVVRYDGDDRYLVVAADKGTATFSDLANELAIARGFWLGDAFASGGKHGYDHKEMGITARGVWESVKRHFRHLGIDPERNDFTVVGIGDMSGDVFGNGMLLSQHIQLVAAFDHRHVFLDPNPDAATSYNERKRLFELPQSSWADYDASLISEGGGVYPRSAKSIPVSPQVRERLGLAQDVVALTPNEMLRGVLRAPVDLLYNGGIGTYVKGTAERNVDVGDKANDAVRINGEELRARAVAEGGNLGFTQDGRVEYALHGGRINTDAIDNSAGVDASDHEVNIKILLDAAVRDAQMTFEERNELLEAMTDEVAGLVLRDNYRQVRALDNARAQAGPMEDVHIRFMHELERSGSLNREVERLPSDETLHERRSAGAGLTTPELAVLLAYAKITLEEELIDSAVPDDPDFLPELIRYFPTQLREKCVEGIRTHPLHREITATTLVNGMVNRAGTTFAFRLGEETGATSAEIVRAHEAARAIFGQETTWRAIEALDGRIAVDVQTEMYLESRKLVERASRWLLRNRRRPLPLASTVAFFAEPVATLQTVLPLGARGNERERIKHVSSSLTARGVPFDLAAQVAAFDLLPSALDIAELAHKYRTDVEHVAILYCVVGDRLRFDFLADRVAELPRDSRWATLARNALREDVAGEHRAVVDAILSSTDPGFDAETAYNVWADGKQDAVARAIHLIDDMSNAGVYDLATLSVVIRELRSLA
jgi:glutamate dehydrogenase